jgi:hypothetical protein
MPAGRCKHGKKPTAQTGHDGQLLLCKAFQDYMRMFLNEPKALIAAE